MYTPDGMSKNGILNESVLILNVNFEPLHVCNTRRALSLVLSGKAKTILNGRGTIRSSTAEFEIPSVIKLNHMVRRPHPKVALSKREILRRDNFTCQYCGRKTHLLTLDHIIPRHRGGPYTWWNLVAACMPCNRRKGGKGLEEANMHLHRQPYEPSPSASYRFGRHLENRQEWAAFIEGW